ncbi:aminoglycoside 3-N-acetyltransferase [Pelagibacterium montanilacus]|uniref:aminoglycoside 3-N-acetyltransferase n=1 Tax=Pelagibacterium montanilacus TaxID=2185280 RepID=UPI000F8F284F|nr:aminoglycoside 3-N-acetyltransferase [Pelagibacterium montanilacus]
MLTRAALRAEIDRIGLVSGDIVMVHAAIGSLGPVLGGPDTVIAALGDAVGPEGTLIAYTDWDASYEQLADAEGRVPEYWKPHIPPFDPVRSRAARENGILPEFLRTTPGALRSASPGASVAALGAKAQAITADHPLDYGYGEGSPFAKLVAAGGKVFMVGAPDDTITLIHHAEHLARIPGKPIKRIEVPFARESGTLWRMIEEFDTARPVMASLAGEDYFGAIVAGAVAAGIARRDRIGPAPCLVTDAAPMVGFAVDWLERLALR